MREPELTYVRGQGWVYVSASSREFMYNGKKYRITIEHRVPEDHERAWDATLILSVTNGQQDAANVTDKDILDDLANHGMLNPAESTRGLTVAPGFGWSGFSKDRSKRSKNHVVVITELIG